MAFTSLAICSHWRHLHQGNKCADDAPCANMVCSIDSSSSWIHTEMIYFCMQQSKSADILFHGWVFFDANQLASPISPVSVGTFPSRSRETLHLPVCTAKLFPTVSTISSNIAQTVCYSCVANQFLIPSHMSSDSSCKGILSREAACVKDILYYLQEPLRIPDCLCIYLY